LNLWIIAAMGRTAQNFPRADLSIRQIQPTNQPAKRCQMLVDPRASLRGNETQIPIAASR
jgi:hypothetical protein